MSRLALLSVFALSSLVLAAPPSPPTAVVPSGPVVSGDPGKRMDAYLIETGFTGGALVAVKGEIVLLKGYGMADREKGIPYRTDTVYPIGSITKPFTATAILKLEMQGKLKVEDSITRFFDSVPEDKKAITVHHLLTHTAGLESDFAGDYDAVGRDEYTRKILASKLRGKPGAAYHYANSGYSLLGAIVERVSGAGYEAFLRKEVFEPAGMKETGYKLPTWPPERIAQGYGPDGRWGTILERRWLDDGPGWALRANGGIHSTLADMYRFDRALDGKAVLSDAAKKKMFTPQVPEGPQADSFYGYGWAIFTTPWKTRLIAHDGGNRIFSADFRRYVDDDIVILTASNDAKVKAFEASPKLARLARGEAPAAGNLGPSARNALGDSPRHAVLRAYFDAFNSGDAQKMREFRKAHLKPPAKMTEEERDQMFRRMWDELGRLEPVGVSEETSESVTVEARSKNVDMPVRMRFLFEPGPQIRIGGISLEIGSHGE